MLLFCKEYFPQSILYFYSAFPTVAIFAGGGPPGNLLRDSWWSPDLMLGTPTSKYVHLVSSHPVSGHVLPGWLTTTFRLPLVHIITFKTHFNWCETFSPLLLFLLLLLLLPPPKKNVPPNCQLPATPDAIFRIQM